MFLVFLLIRGFESGVNYPSECTTPSGFDCTFNVALLYSGSREELSDDPLSYRGIGVEVNDPTTIELLLRDDITNFQVQVVPESDSALGILALGIGGAGLQVLRNYRTKTAFRSRKSQDVRLK